MKDALLQDVTTNAAIHSERVYLIGTLDGQLASELEASVDFTPYDGTTTDGPIFLSPSGLAALTDAQEAGMLAAFQARVPIVLVDAGADAVNRLIDILHGERFDFTMPDGIEKVEIFAIDLEANGDVYHWATYPPQEVAEDPDGTGDQQARVNHLVAWLKANGGRCDVDEAGRVAAKARLQNAAAAGGQELTTLASAFVKQDNFSQFGNNYQISHYVYGCHSVTTGDDWIYVQQRCLFYSGGAYKGKTEWAGIPGASAAWYLDTITIDTVLKGYENNTAAVGLQQSSPETANNVTQVSSDVSWNVGGDVSVSKSGPAATISGGVSISNSTTVNIQDCDVLNQSITRGNNAAWSFNFKKCNTVAYIGYAGLTDPPRLATTTFQPCNQWIWHVMPSARAAKPPMRVRLKVALVGTLGRWDFLWVAHPEHNPLDGGSWEYDVPFDYPPIVR